MHIGKYFIGRAERITLGLIFALAFGALVLSALATSPDTIRSTSHSPNPKADATQPLSQEQKDSILRTKGYVGPPERLRAGANGNKFRQHTVLDLNTADSATLIRVPGIGPTFAHRIIDLRTRLGGFYTVYQLQEVYGIDADRFLALRSWFHTRSPHQRHPLGQLISGQVPRHPYLHWEQRKEMERLLHRHGTALSWRILRKSKLFTYDDSVRLSPYFPDSPPAQSQATDSLSKE